ncbi:MAG: Druantia anti-phage system protein DruA [Candidatus Dormibacteria bacterium]
MAAGIAGPGPVNSSRRYCAREFSAEDMEVVRQLTVTLPHRSAIAAELCAELGWRRPDGRPKEMSARVALLRMERDGLVTLPPPRNPNGNGHILRYAKPELRWVKAAPPSLSALGRIELVVVDTPAASRRWRGLIGSYHYLGNTHFAGAQLRYLVESSWGTLGALGFAASAWKCAPRDAHIGWDPPIREARLHLVVGNARFLILPHVRVPNLASTVIARAVRLRLLARALGDLRRGRPLHRYQLPAANWIHVGQTKGRGKLDRYNRYALPIKDIYLYPLQRDYRRILTAPV